MTEARFSGCGSDDAPVVGEGFVAIGGSIRLMMEGEARAFGEVNVGCEGGCENLDCGWSEGRWEEVEVGCL